MILCDEASTQKSSVQKTYRREWDMLHKAKISNTTRASNVLQQYYLDAKANPSFPKVTAWAPDILTIHNNYTQDIRPRFPIQITRERDSTVHLVRCIHARSQVAKSNNSLTTEAVYYIVPLNTSYRLLYNRVILSFMIFPVVLLDDSTWNWGVVLKTTSVKVSYSAPYTETPRAMFACEPLKRTSCLSNSVYGISSVQLQSFSEPYFRL